jgi:hypothetical protein
MTAPALVLSRDLCFISKHLHVVLMYAKCAADDHLFAPTYNVPCASAFALSLHARYMCLSIGMLCSSHEEAIM